MGNIKTIIGLRGTVAELLLEEETWVPSPEDWQMWRDRYETIIYIDYQAPELIIHRGNKVQHYDFQDKTRK